LRGKRWGLEKGYKLEEGLLNLVKGGGGGKGEGWFFGLIDRKGLAPYGDQRAIRRKGTIRKRKKGVKIWERAVNSQ